MEDYLLLGEGFFVPNVELGQFFGVEAGFGGEDHGPEDAAGGVDDGGGGAGGVDEAVPLAEDVGGLVKALGVGGDLGVGVIDGVGEALGEDVVEVRVDVGLELEHG